MMLQKLRFHWKTVLGHRLFWSSVVFVVTLIFYITGYGSEYWNERLDSHYGLWRSCSGGACYKSVGFRAPVWLRAAQAMCSLGLVSAIISASTLVVWILLQIRSFEEILDHHVLAWTLSRWTSAIGCTTAGFFGVIGVIIYGDSHQAMTTAEASAAPVGWGYWFMVLASLVFLGLGLFWVHLAWISPDLNSVSPTTPEPESSKIATPVREPSAPPPPPPPSPPEYTDDYSFGMNYARYPHQSPIRTTDAQKKHEQHSIDVVEGGRWAQSIPEDTLELDALTSGRQGSSRGLSSMTSLSRLYASALGKRHITEEESPTPEHWVASRNAVTEVGQLKESTQSSWRGQNLPPRRTYTA